MDALRRRFGFCFAIVARVFHPRGEKQVRANKARFYRTNALRLFNCLRILRQFFLRRSLKTVFLVPSPPSASLDQPYWQQPLFWSLSQA